jgi:glutamyl-tRNA reductase
VALREQLSCSLADIEVYARQYTSISEFILLSTCNRIELYAVINDSPAQAEALLLGLWAQTRGLNPAQFADYVTRFAGEAVSDHLLKVAAGLESLVLGEPQILGQVTDAYVTAVARRTTGPILDALFKAAIRTGKRTRSETAISSNPASISSVAIALAQQVLGDLSNRSTLIIGVGEMSRLAVKALRSRGWHNIAVANRTVVRAEAMVADWHGRFYSLDQLPHAIAEADVVITAVRRDSPLIDETMIGERERPLILVDLAVPRNVTPTVCQLPHVQLFGVDDLQATLDESLAARQAEIPAVKAIIAAEKAKLQDQLRQLTIKPLIIDMRRKAEEIRQTELERTLRHLGEVDPQTWSHIQHLSRSLVNKLLHEPTVRLRQKASDDAAEEYASTVRDLFGLADS